MKTTFGFKLSRRLLSAVVVSDGEIVYYDLRHMPAQPDRAEQTLKHHFGQLAHQFGPTDLAYYAPTPAESFAGRSTRLLEEQAAEIGLPIQRLNRTDLFTAFSLM